MDEKWQALRIINPILSKAQDDDKVEALQFYFQQLWQMDNLIVLTGAGFTKHVGGPLMSDLSRGILPGIVLTGIKGQIENAPFAALWRTLWEIDGAVWEVVEQSIAAGSGAIPEELAQHCATLNIEEKTSLLQVVISAFEGIGFHSAPYRTALVNIQKRIVSRMREICPELGGADFSNFSEKLQPYRDLIRRLVGYRRPQQPRVKLFTLNYDTVIETACDLNGTMCITGFEGRHIRVLNPTTFDLDPVFQATSESSVYYPNVVHLYKLHGSIDWHLVDVDGIPEIVEDSNASAESVVIYPCHTKFAEALDVPYYEMFRRLGEAVSRSQTVVLTLGYGFNDDHVNQLLLRAYKNPSCQIVLCEPRVTGEEAQGNRFLASMLKVAAPKETSAATDPRVTILGGDTARFPDILNVIFHPMTVESPSDEIRRLVKRLISYGEE